MVEMSLAPRRIPMNTLLSTTALVVALGIPGMAFAQSTDSAGQTETQQQQNGMQSGFMVMRGESDIFASELMGHDVYARRSGQNELRTNDGQAAATDGQAQSGANQHMNADGGSRMGMINRSDIENMEQIGQINEIVISNDGEVRALVIGVGGFLGMGEQDVAITMDQVTFVSDAEDRSQMYVVLNTSVDMLNNAPAYDRTASATGDMPGEGDRRAVNMASADGTQGMAQNEDIRTGFAAPQMERDGYSRMEARDVSTEMLIGKSVYDTQDNDVGSIDDMLLDEDGAVSHIIIDFGGFLGIGSSQALIGFDELTILTTEGYSDVRVYVDATKAQIQDLPRYSARN
ncbi:MAG: PRC-barrel domain containing protein [Rhodobacteraceae bacterium]|nr:MAG: PRC-barrel domain containing protein [Paracoccaceae bacterium]